MYGNKPVGWALQADQGVTELPLPMPVSGDQQGPCLYQLVQLSTRSLQEPYQGRQGKNPLGSTNTCPEATQVTPVKYSLAPCLSGGSPPAGPSLASSSTRRTETILAPFCYGVNQGEPLLSSVQLLH